MPSAEPLIKPTTILEASLHSSASTLQAMPDEGCKEVAIIGRSNVGKSSLLNRLTGRKNLAYTSSVPGKTQSFQSYQIKVRESNDKTNLKYFFHLVDLPGFGYAKFAKKKREYISRLTVEYIAHRQALCGILLLNDIRRVPEEDEYAIQKICFENERPLIIVLTKADKLKKSEINKRTKIIADHYRLEPEDLVITGDKMPTSAVWERVFPLV